MRLVSSVIQDLRKSFPIPAAADLRRFTPKPLLARTLIFFTTFLLQPLRGLLKRTRPKTKKVREMECQLIIP
jgi:hypothetical protein